MQALDETNLLEEKYPMIVGLYDKGPQIVTVVGQIDCLKCGRSHAWMTCISINSLQSEIEQQKVSLANQVGPCSGTTDHVWSVMISYRPFAPKI